MLQNLPLAAVRLPRREPAAPYVPLRLKLGLCGKDVGALPDKLGREAHRQVRRERKRDKIDLRKRHLRRRHALKCRQQVLGFAHLLTQRGQEGLVGGNLSPHGEHG